MTMLVANRTVVTVGPKIARSTRIASNAGPARGARAGARDAVTAAPARGDALTATNAGWTIIARGA